MNTEQLERMHTGKGFIAALDQSGGSTPGALALYGVPESSYRDEDEMYTIVHAMRTRVLTNGAFDSSRVLGVILFADTMRRRVEGLPTANYLWDVKGIIPFLKIDQGLMEPTGGVQLMKSIPGLSTLLREAREAGIFGTKMRSVIHQSDPVGIANIAEQQFAVAREIIRAGLVPIIEPEVSIHSDDRAESEAYLKEELYKGLDTLGKNERIMLKISIPEQDGFYGDLMTHPKVLRVVALSGGFSREEANALLKRNPGLIASFSRALVEGLHADQDAAEFTSVLTQSIGEIYEASIL